MRRWHRLHAWDTGRGTQCPISKLSALPCPPAGPRGHSTTAGQDQHGGRWCLGPWPCARDSARSHQLLLSLLTRLYLHVLRHQWCGLLAFIYEPWGFKKQKDIRTLPSLMLESFYPGLSHSFLGRGAALEEHLMGTQSLIWIVPPLLLWLVVFEPNLSFPFAFTAGLQNAWEQLWPHIFTPLFSPFI